MKHDPNTPRPATDIDEAHLARMAERGAVAWAGVDADELRAFPAVSAKNRLLQVERSIQHRISDNGAAFQAALRDNQWSQVAGLHGIGTGLLMALRIVQDELKYASE